MRPLVPAPQRTRLKTIAGDDHEDPCESARPCPLGQPLRPRRQLQLFRLPEQCPGRGHLSPARWLGRDGAILYPSRGASGDHRRQSGHGVQIPDVRHALYGLAPRAPRPRLVLGVREEQSAIHLPNHSGGGAIIAQAFPNAHSYALLSRQRQFARHRVGSYECLASLCLQRESSNNREFAC